MSSGSAAERYAFGGLSCMAAALVTNPVDVLKTRLQIHGELGGSSQGRLGVIQGVVLITRNEGALAFYKGIGPAMVREAIYSTIRMGGYDSLKLRYLRPGDRDLPLAQKIPIAAFTGAVGSVFCNPFDLIKVRMQAAVEPKFRGTVSALRQVITYEGWRGLAKGVGPSAQRACLLTGSQLPSYDTFKHYMMDKGYMGEGRPLHFLSSIFAGLVCAITTAPLDNIKTRIMNQPFDARGVGLIYKNSVDCAVKTFKSEGMLGLYKGFLPQWLRIGPHTIVTFIVYEHLRHLAGMKPV
eukprot:m.307334 g.307334  ORF g.307334 m.307334 type:complete len:295 (-) comp19872_c0_seq1:105-989(-)